MKKIYDFIENTVGMDKVAHFFGVAFLSLVVAIAYAKVAAGYSPLTYAAWGFICGVMVSIVKEMVDAANDRKFDFGDIAASSVGAFMSFLVALVLL